MKNGNPIAISIVLYCNPQPQIQKVLDSIRSSQVPYTLFMVDNSPTRDFFSWFSPTEQENYWYLGKNIGFGSAHNLAISESLKRNCPYHLVLNPDVYFGPEVLKTVAEYMDSHPEIGLLTPKVLYPDGQVQFLCKRLPKPYDLFIRRFGPKALKEKNNFHFEMRDRDYSQIMEVPSLSGCFMFFRNTVLQKIGGFDERFFMYLEDVDISRRSAKVAKNIHFPVVSIFHEHGKGSYKSLRLLWYHISSTFKYFWKWGV